jgi:hypothetical protein
LVISAVYLGVGQAACDAACDYANQRVPSSLGKPIAELPNIVAIKYSVPREMYARLTKMVGDQLIAHGRIHDVLLQIENRMFFPHIFHDDRIPKPLALDQPCTGFLMPEWLDFSSRQSPSCVHVSLPVGHQATSFIYRHELTDCFDSLTAFSF